MNRQQEKSKPVSDRALRASREAAHRSAGATPGQLQRTLGNQAMLRLLHSGALQAKLTVSKPDDSYEQEADRVADQVVRMAKPAGHELHPQGPAVSPMLQRQESSFPPDAEEKLKGGQSVQRKAEDESAVSPPVEAQLNAASAAGRRLPSTVQTFMEDRFGAGFDHVRIHTDADAAQLSRSLHAEAFTHGSHIYFGAGRFSPASDDGKRLLAHELTHTIQQQGIQRKMIQRRGGPSVGRLSVRTNVIDAGLTAGHAWLSYTPTGGSETTYGTWGNRNPIGLYRDLEVGRSFAASRTSDIDSSDQGKLTSFASANNSWSLFNNCASFAARGWLTVTGESLSYTNSLGIPNPSSLGAGIKAANGGAAHGSMAGAGTGGPGSSHGSSGSGSAGSSGGASTGSSGGSSGSSL